MLLDPTRLQDVDVLRDGPHRGEVVRDEQQGRLVLALHRPHQLQERRLVRSQTVAVHRAEEGQVARAAGFQKRLAALVVDVLVLSPLIVASIWTASRTKDVYRNFLVLSFLKDQWQKLDNVGFASFRDRSQELDLDKLNGPQAVELLRGRLKG